MKVFSIVLIVSLIITFCIISLIAQVNDNIETITLEQETQKPKSITQILATPLRDIDDNNQLNETNFDYLIDYNSITYITTEKELYQQIDSLYSQLQDDYSIFYEVIREEEAKRREYQRIEKPIASVDIEQIDSKVFARGNILFGVSYGSIRRTPEITTPISSYIKENFNVNQDMRILSTSKIGDKVNVDIEFDQRSAINRFNVSYKEPEQSQQFNPPPQNIPTPKYDDNKPFVRELTFGEVSFSKPISKYITFTAISKSAQGIKFVGKNNNFYIEAIGTLTTTIPSKKTFTGTKRVNERIIRDIDFVKRRYFKLPDSNIDVNSISLLISVSISETPDVVIDGIPFKKLIQGSDYSFDRILSEIELKYNLERNKSLAIFYTHNSGQNITISSNIYRGNGSDGKEYLYLYKSELGYSPFELKNIYTIDSAELNLSRDIEITVYYTSDPTITAPFQFTSQDYYIDIYKGIIRFKSLTPFITNANYDIYSLPRDPIDSESTYSIRIKYYENVISYQLDFDIVEDSEEVKINGVLIPKDKYSILYPIGRITFKDPTLINEGDIVEISYEYRPFFGSSQKLSLGMISEYSPTTFFNTKLSTAIWTSQTRGSAPTISTLPPEAGIITSIVNTINLQELLNIKDNFKGDLSFEYAVSIVNPNSFGSAIIEDFESNKKSFILSKDEDNWYLSPESVNDGCYNTNRGKLLYKDYRQYFANESFVLMSFNWNLPNEQILPYSQKPGPYIASGGRLSPGDFPNVSQISIIFDYDFSDGEWVGSILPISSAGLDLSDLTEIIISYKLQMDNDNNNVYEDNNTNKLIFLFQLGQFSEDLDGDGILDYEITTSQNGFEFNNPTNGNVITRIGGGRKGSGNGKIDSEDFNKNGRLDTNENYVSFSNIIEGSDWKKITISTPSLSPTEKDILRKTYAVRIILKKLNGIKGRVIIDEIQLKFKTSPIYKVDGIILQNPYQIVSTTISVYDSPLYQKNRFFNIEAKTQEEKERLQEYSYLHGTGALSIAEAKSIDETSLRILYNLSNVNISTNFPPYQGGKEATTVIRFNASQNFSHYSKLIFYVFIPTKNELGQPIKLPSDTLSDENIIIRLLSKEKDYFELEIPMDRLKKDEWNRIEVRIREDYTIIINNDFYNPLRTKIYGFPSIRDINSIELGVRVNDNSVEPLNIGEVWFNEIFLSDSKWYVSSALNSSLSLNYTSGINLFNFSVVSNIYTTFLVENIFPDFKGNGGKENINTFLITHFYSSEFLRYTLLNYSVSLTKENTSQDKTLPEYLLYDITTRSFKYSITSKHGIDFLPSMSYSFSDRQISSFENGLSAFGTNTIIRNIISEEVGLDSYLNISYNLPFLTRYLNLRNSLTLSSSYSGKNYNSRTNNIFFYYLPSYENWIYSLGLDTSFNYSSININNSFKHSETFNNTSTNLINSIEKLSLSSIPERNQYSLQLLLEGFKERGNRKEVSEQNTLTISIFNLLNGVNLYITPLYDFRDFNFNYTSNTILRDIRLEGKITYRTDISINKLIFNTLSLNSSFNTTFSGNAIDYNLKWYDFYTNNLYRGIIAIPFYEYSGLFGYQNLESALLFVSNLSEYRSIINQFNSSGISLSLMNIDDLFLSIIPRNYSFDYSTTTVRELNSYRQSTRLVLTATSYIPIYKANWFIFRRDKDISANDILINFSFSKEDNYNTLITQNKITLSSSFSGIVSTQQSFSISYTLSYSYQDNITNIPQFYTNFGMGLSTEQSLLSSINHLIKLSYSYSISSENDIDLLITKIRLPYQMENKEEITFTYDQPWYNNNKFNSFKRKIFELNFYHETSMNFSDFIRFSGYSKFLLAQMSEIYVENEIIKEKLFDLIPGIELGINIRVTF